MHIAVVPSFHSILSPHTLFIKRLVVNILSLSVSSVFCSVGLSRNIPVSSALHCNVKTITEGLCGGKFFCAARKKQLLQEEPVIWGWG